MSPETQNFFNFFRTIAISTIIILLWVVPFLIMSWRAGTPGSHVWGFLSIIALTATVISPPGIWMVIARFDRRDNNRGNTIPAGDTVFRDPASPGRTDANFLACSVVYTISLSILGGLEGFFAAKKTTGYLLIALLLAGVWAGIFFSGIH